MRLPSRATIAAWKSSANFSEGLCRPLLNLLESRTSKLQPENKLCTLIIGRMVLERPPSVATGGDSAQQQKRQETSESEVQAAINSITGEATFVQNREGEEGGADIKEDEEKNHVLVFMVAGLNGNLKHFKWRQAFQYQVH